MKLNLNLNLVSPSNYPKGYIILLITLLVATIATVYIGSRLVIIRQDNRIEVAKREERIAKRTAYAGLDLGLFYFRMNHDMEMSDNCPDITKKETEQNGCQSPTKDEGNPVRIYLNRMSCPISEIKNESQCFNLPITTNGQSNPYWEAKPTSPLPPNEQTIGLKIFYKQSGGIGSPNLLHLAEPKESGNPIVYQDNPFELSGLQETSSFRLNLAGLQVENQYFDYIPKGTTWKEAVEEFKKHNSGKFPDPKNDDSEHLNFFKQFCKNPNTIITKKTPGIKEEEGRFRIAQSDILPCGVLAILPYKKGLEKKSTESDFYSFRDLVNFTPDEKPNKPDKVLFFGQITYIRLKPINMDLQLAIDTLNHSYGNPNIQTTGTYLDSGITHIESTGYYGKSKVKVEATVDRISNKVLGVFDYVLYSKEPIKK